MNPRTIAILVILVVLAGAAYFFYAKPAEAPATQSTVYSWELTALPENAGAPGVPRTGVVLLAGERRHVVGEFDGSCLEIDNTSWTLQEGEKTGVICWFAGGGSEAGVFTENGKDVLKLGDLDEGDAETPGFRGNYRTLIEL